MSGSSTTAPAPTGYSTEIRLLFRTAMLVFVITVGIGLLNGLDLVEFDRNTVLTHVHAGTIGWITLSVFAFTLWLMGGDETSLGRGSAWLAVVAVPLYVLAFWSGRFTLMAVFGTAVLLAIFGFLAHAARAYMRSEATTPKLAVVASLLTLAIGSSIGVLIQIERAIGEPFLPGEAIGGHAGAQVVGYLVLVGMALAEWRLAPEARLNRLALTQVALLFVGGLLVSIGALTGSEPLLGAFIPLELVALGIFLFRLGPRAARAPWLERGEIRHFALTVPFLVVNVILLVTLLSGVISGRYEDFTAVPPWLIFAFDHAMFIGVMTNALFGRCSRAGTAVG